jgi:hypothetical protein
LCEIKPILTAICLEGAFALGHTKNNFPSSDSHSFLILDNNPTGSSICSRTWVKMILSYFLGNSTFSNNEL